MIKKNLQIYKFSAYGFLKNLRFFDPFILLFFREMGISFLQIGLLFSIREITTNIVEIPSGIIADNFGRKRAMIISFSAYIISFLLIFFFPAYLFYSLAMIFFGVGEAFRSGTHKAMIFDYLQMKGWQDKKVEYYGFTRSWSQIGSAISALIAGVIVFYSGSYKNIFILSIIPYLLDLLLIISYPNELNGLHSIRKKSSDFSQTEFVKVKKIIKDFVKLFKEKNLRKAMINSTLFDSVFKSTKDYIQPILFILAASITLGNNFTEKQISAITIALVYFILFLISAFASRHSGSVKNLFSDISNAVNITYVLGTLLIFFSGILLILELKLYAIIMLILLYAFQNFRRPMNVSVISELVPQHVMASGLSLESQLKTLLIVIFAPSMGFMVDKFGIGFGLIFFGILMLLFIPIIWLKSDEK